jgi:parallel beta-helix repeat protein
MSEARKGSRTLSAASTLAVVIAGTVIAVPAPARAGAVPAAVSQETTLHCGDTITADTELHADLVNCPNDGLVIGADNITLDLNGHTIDGDGVPSDCPADGNCDVGVANFDGHDGVAVVGGKVRQFRLGVFVGGGAVHNRLGQLIVEDNSEVGVVVLESTGSVIEKNSMRDNGSSGLVLVNSQGALVTRNSVSGSQGFGIFLALVDDSTIEGNVVGGNDHGIAVDGSSRNTVRRNTLSHNRGSAIDLGDGAATNHVEHNHLADNGDGIVLEEVTGNLIGDNVVTGTGFFGFPDAGGFGIILDGADRNKLDRNTVTGGRGPAILVLTLDAPTASEGNTVSRNVANSRQSDGIYVGTGATATVVERNTANHSGNDGIHVDGPTTRLTRNIANNNHNLGIEAVPGVTDGGGNHASHNGNPAQCTNLSC